MMGQEGPLSGISTQSYIQTLAASHQALVVAMEHRFYGESLPAPTVVSFSFLFIFFTKKNKEK